LASRRIIPQVLADNEIIFGIFLSSGESTEKTGFFTDSSGIHQFKMDKNPFVNALLSGKLIAAMV
jgi:hypothetical protein